MAKYRYQGKIAKTKIEGSDFCIFLYVDNSLLQEVNGKRYLCLPNLEPSSGNNQDSGENTLEAKRFEIKDNLLELSVNQSKIKKICILLLLQKSSSVIVEFDDKKNITSIEFFLD